MKKYKDHKDWFLSGNVLIRNWSKHARSIISKYFNISHAICDYLEKNYLIYNRSEFCFKYADYYENDDYAVFSDLEKFLDAPIPEHKVKILPESQVNDKIQAIADYIVKNDIDIKRIAFFADGLFVLLDSDGISVHGVTSENKKVLDMVHDAAEDFLDQTFVIR